MIPTRVLLIDLPPMLRDIVTSALTDRDVEVASGAGPVSAAEADVVIVGEAAATRGELCRLLERRPRTRAVRLLADGERAVLYELRPHAQPLPDGGEKQLSPAHLRAALRRLARPCPDWIPHPE